MAGDGKKKLTTAQAKEMYISLLAQGHSQASILRTIGREKSSYFDWRKKDEPFRLRVDGIRDFKRTGERVPVPDFPEFCEQYLNMPLFTHQLQWFDLLEGRDPRDLHPSQTYERGDRNFLLVNCPPEHAKTFTLSISYATWRICKDPNVRILFVSKTQEMAKQMMYAVKNRLTHPQYMKLQLDFGPPGGWKEDSDVWAADKVYLGSARDGEQKDPTLQARGIGGQIYGMRLDLVFVDDAVVLSNAHEYEKQIRWIQQEVLTRGGPGAKLLVIGTRVDPIDLYSELRNPERYPSGSSPWTYLAQPAVLEFAEKPDDWVTLWPRSNEPWQGLLEAPGPDGLYPRWDGKHLSKRRGLLAARTWALAYMQASIAEDSVFRQEVIRASINGRRQPGVMTPGAIGHRPEGMEGLYVIGSMDPAMTGNTGVIVMGVDRLLKRRYVLAVYNKPGATPHWIRTTIKDLTDVYGIHEWRIEKNAFQSFLTQDPELHEHLSGMGVRIHEHFTGKNKWDIDYGVASMAPVFESGFMELPSTKSIEACKQLVEQLITWAPETKNKTDLVMALWFADVRAREVILGNSAAKGQTNFMQNRFLTRRAKSQQIVVNLNDLAIARR